MAMGKAAMFRDSGYCKSYHILVFWQWERLPCAGILAMGRVAMFQDSDFERGALIRESGSGTGCHVPGSYIAVGWGCHIP